MILSLTRPVALPPIVDGRFTRPLVALSLGAGVQSSTLGLQESAGDVEPCADVAIFADTHDEPEEVYTWLEWLERQLTFPVTRVSQGSLSADALRVLVNKKTGREYCSNSLPVFVKSAGKHREGRVGRHCTRDYKIFPIQKYLRSLVPREVFTAWRRKYKSELTAIRVHERTVLAARKLENAAKVAKKRGDHAAVDTLTAEARRLRATTSFPAGAWANCHADPIVVQHIGISRDEVVRAKPSRVPWIRVDFPLIHDKPQRRADCLRWFTENAHRFEPAPFAKPPRSACIYCPYKSNAEWRRLRDESPEEFARAAVFERELQTSQAGIVTAGKIKGVPFLHRTLRPLREVDLSTEAERGQPSLFGDMAEECEGMCGL